MSKLLNINYNSMLIKNKNKHSIIFSDNCQDLLNLNKFDSFY